MSQPVACKMCPDHLVELLHLGREYPLGYDYFQPRLHQAFMSRAAERDEDKIRAGIAHAEYVKKGARLHVLLVYCVYAIELAN